MKIILDNGHGKNTKGKCSPDKSFYEWEFNREIVKGIKEKLEKLGYDVINLVPEDIDISLSERVKRANKIYNEDKNCILISIHSNAAGNGVSWGDARGFQLHIYGNSEISKKLANSIYDEVENMGLRARKPKPTQKYWTNSFYILKNTKMPAILTENFFYDNKEDLEYLKSEKGKEEIISYHIQGIINYINQVNKIYKSFNDMREDILKNEKKS